MANYQPTKWEEKFLDLYRKSGNITLSARGAGVTRSAVYDRRESYPRFAEIMDAAKTEAIESLEAVAWERARKTSDVLLIFLLKSLKPEMYHERQRVDNTGEVKITVVRE